ncbi:phosphatidate cytidylyltransferase [Mucilaginibacter boryungensis]|uniref:Phosphatidate cytidylyltransferase n=1 Tax=Mucilaginibacter boryungensis TaxID=768480 RepID=A0ABR9XJA5_9SPHI|nr:phosphatidate cytidylyltransferase [Mucilaginibacter boryungensis]MBE9667120.1 phosphatidate cytidylyltransferase [Mucilaginibacter boryungensis]
MKKLNIFLIAFVVATLSSCQVIGGLLKASFAVGIIVALVVVFLIIWLISAFRGRN